MTPSDRFVTLGRTSPWEKVGLYEPNAPSERSLPAASAVFSSIRQHDHLVAHHDGSHNLRRSSCRIRSERDNCGRRLTATFSDATLFYRLPRIHHRFPWRFLPGLVCLGGFLFVPPGNGFSCRYDLAMTASSNLGGSEVNQGPVDFMQCSGHIESSGSTLIFLSAGVYTLTESFTATDRGGPVPDLGGGLSNDLYPTPEPVWTAIPAVALIFLAVLGWRRSKLGSI